LQAKRREPCQPTNLISPSACGINDDFCTGNDTIMTPNLPTLVDAI
jgi:hypothetical protein